MHMINPAYVLVRCESDGEGPREEIEQQGREGESVEGKGRKSRN